MLGFTICILFLSFILPGDTVSDEKFTALKFGDDGRSVISFSPDMSPLTEKFTVCLWVRKLLSGSNPVAFSYTPHMMYMHDNGNYLTLGGNMGPSSEIPIGKWYQFCGTWSSASRTIRTYYNGTLAETYITDSGRKLQTGGTLVLGDYWDPVSSATGNHFGGEMYNFNMFSKELTGTEVAELSADGLCTQVPEQLENYRVIKWNEILGLTRRGNVQNIETGCDETIDCETEKVSLEESLQRTQAELLEVQEQFNSTMKEVKRKLLAKEGELSETRIELEETALQLSETRIGLKDTTLELNETRIELEETKQELQNVSENVLQKGKLTKWDVFYSCAYYGKIFTRRSYNKLRPTLGSLARPLLSKKITDEVIERMKDQHEDTKCG